MSYLPTVAWRTLIGNVYQVDGTTYEVTVAQQNPNDPGAFTEDVQVGYYVRDYVGHMYTVSGVSVGGDFHRIQVTDDLTSGVGPQQGRMALVYKSVGDGGAPFIAPIQHRILDESAIDYARPIELDIFWKNLLHLDQTTPQTIINGIPRSDAVLADFTESNMFITKEYADSAISFINTFYFQDTASSIGGIYYKMLESPSGEAESTFISGSLSAGNDQNIYNFATDAGIPGVITLRHGVYQVHIHAKKAASGNKPTQIYYRIYTRNVGGTETLRTTSEISELLTNVIGDYTLHAVITEDIDILTTDRLVVKWYVNVGVTGTDPVVTLYAEGTYQSRLAVPTTTEVLSYIFLRQDGTKALTNNWDAGSFQIRAETFQSDVATGTPPLVVASTTKVENLNVDLLDGKEASEFATSTHVHGNVTNDGKIGSTAALPVVTGTAGVLTVGVTQTPQALTQSTSTLTWDIANGYNARVTLTASITTFTWSTAAVAGDSGVLTVIQNATGGWTMVLPSGHLKEGGTLTLSTAANAKDVLGWYYDGTNYFWNIGKAFA